MAAAGEVASARAGAAGGFLQKFRLYETRSMFYMIGRDKRRMMWRVLKIDRLESSELAIHEDPTVFTESECHGLLQRIHEGNRSTGGLKYVTKCYGIVGFVKFLGPYYMLLITKRRKIGTICGHVVYTISKSEIIRLPCSTMLSNMAYSKDENRYKRLLCTVDLTKDFFFSYSYNIMRSLQKNICQPETAQGLYDTMFVWNEFLTRGIRNQLKNTNWTVALVHGFFKQSKLSTCGKDFRLTLIARRSRHFAGTRYLKRGVNEKGRVANDVETEQIVFEDTPGEVPPQITSVVQNRGSIPLFWSQETSRLNIRPDIILQEKDPKYEATRLHFDNLVKRYGNPIIILNLIKTREKKPRESLLRAEFAKAIYNINKGLSEESRLRFLHWDLNKHSRRKGTNVLALLGRVAANALNLTDIFHCQIATESRSQDALRRQNVGNCMRDGQSRTDDAVLPGNGYEEDEANNVDTHKVETSDSKRISDVNCLFKPLLVQKGVLRTNCIDCLDRTNVAQYAYGLAAFGRQLHALELMDVPSIDLDAALADDLMILYERMGDTLALQYGGSAAHNKIFSERRGQWKPAVQSQELIRTIQRYYNNAYLDAEKQDAINVFLGHFQPQLGKAALWELDSDQHYNIGRRGYGFPDENARSFIKRSLSDGNILCESNTLCEVNTPLSTYNVGPNEIQKSTLPPRMHQLEDVTGLSDSAPEISTCESGLSYSRYIPAMSQRHLFPDNNQDSFLSGLGSDESNWSNFLDLDWLSSSGNSCEDETFERSSLINSPAGNVSSENVIDGINADTDTTLNHEVSCIEEREETNVESPHDAPQSSEVLDEFPDSFVEWIEKGGTIFYV
ncbi:phosphoinositide phosphatase SAC2-like isoform X2 [Typha latifolia]|uniref:phosphoinositide phosphatase SAC2-like isoform X2 n=1 Tax=Typha latifolia TaxID=4733 RepID=UPI003C2D7D31